MTGSLQMDDIKIRWKIEYFFDILKSSSTVESPNILLKNQLWNISISFPNDFCEFKLHPKTPQSEEIFVLNISLKFSDGYPFINSRIEFPSNVTAMSNLTKSDFYSYKDRIAEDESLTFECTIHYEKDGCIKDLKPIQPFKLFAKSQTQDTSSQTITLNDIETLSDNFKELFTNGHHADIKIRVGKKEFQVHKSVLVARSPVFNSMFSSNMLENRNKIIDITDCDEDAFKIFLTYLYSGKLDTVESNKVADLYKISDKYQILELKRECLRRLTNEMTIDTVCNSLRVAAMHGERKLLETATNFFVDNAEDILYTSNWQLLSHDLPNIRYDLFLKYIEKSKNKVCVKVVHFLRIRYKVKINCNRNENKVF